MASTDLPALFFLWGVVKACSVAFVILGVTSENQIFPVWLIVMILGAAFEN